MRSKQSIDVSRLSMTPELSLSIFANMSDSFEANSSLSSPLSAATKPSCIRFRFSARALAFCSAKPWIRIAMKRLSSIQLPMTMIL